MNFAVTLLSALALMGYAAAAVDVPWQPFPDAELQEMNYDFSEEMSFEQDDTEPGQEEDAALIEQSIQWEMDYPTAQSMPAAIQGEFKRSINVNSLSSGSVQALYRTPNKGRVILNLIDKKENILLHVDARVDWNGEKNTLVINSKSANGPWLTEIRPKGFPFRCCGYVTTVALRVYIFSYGFVVTANGKTIKTVPYRNGLRPPVSKVEYISIDSNASKKARLYSMSVFN